MLWIMISFAVLSLLFSVFVINQKRHLENYDIIIPIKQELPKLERNEPRMTLSTFEVTESFLRSYREGRQEAASVIAYYQPYEFMFANWIRKTEPQLKLSPERCTALWLKAIELSLDYYPISMTIPFSTYVFQVAKRLIREEVHPKRQIVLKEIQG